MLPLMYPSGRLQDLFHLVSVVFFQEAWGSMVPYVICRRVGDTRVGPPTYVVTSGFPPKVRGNDNAGIVLHDIFVIEGGSRIRELRDDNGWWTSR